VSLTNKCLFLFNFQIYATFVSALLL